MGKPRIGKEVREVCSIRLEKSVKESILKEYGTLTVFINQAIARDKRLKKKAK